MSRHPSSPRSIALQCLLKWDAGKGFAETLVDRLAAEAKLPPNDRHLVQAIVFGVLRNKTWLDSIISSLRQGRLDATTLAILEIGACQIFVMGLADHAAVYETVNLANPRTRGVVNGILRNAIRKKDSCLSQVNALPLHVRYSTPEWLVNRWNGQFGRLNTVRLLEWNNTSPTLYARRNPLVAYTPDPGVLEPLAGLPNWYAVKGPLPVGDIRSGAIYITDPSTRHSVDLLDPQPNERILDACAAPGGKSSAIIAATAGKASLTATDLHAHRLPVLLDNLQKQGSEHVETAQMDWTLPCPPCWEGYFDAVLLDVPCSNTGVMQRRVDVRWRLTPGELDRLAAVQAAILENACRSVKPGGRLVYSTCSIDEEEDTNLVHRFLCKHPEYTLKKETLVLPFEEKTDGAYAALLIRA